MYEIQDHESLVLEAFRKGQKPPMKLSQAEKDEIDRMIQLVEKQRKKES